MSWIVLVIAGLFELACAVGLKYTEGFTRLWTTVGTLLAMGIIIGLLGISMKSLPVGTADAVRLGVGAVGTAILGIFLFNKPANAGRLVSFALILAGITGLKLATPARRYIAFMQKTVFFSINKCCSAINMGTRRTLIHSNRPPVRRSQ